MADINQKRFESIEKNLIEIRKVMNRIEVNESIHFAHSSISWYHAIGLSLIVGGIAVVATIAFPKDLSGWALIILGLVGVFQAQRYSKNIAKLESEIKKTLDSK